MDKKEVVKALKTAKENSPKRNFKQRIDMILTLKNIDVKKPDQQVDAYINLHYPKAKKQKVCGLVGPELYEQAKSVFDEAIHIDDFPKYKENKDKKKLAQQYDFFVAQGDVMQKVAQNFGKAFGPRGKMPNPKAGCVVPPNANLKSLYDRLQTTEHLKVKSQKMFQAAIGYEDTDEEQVIDNALTIYNQLIHHLPQEKNNVKEIVFKLTMGKPVKLSEVKD